MVPVTGRGQLVVVTGAIVAIAFVPILVATVQVSEPPPPQSTDTPFREAEHLLETAVAHLPVVATRFSWTDRWNATDHIRDRLAPTLERLRTSDSTGLQSIDFASITATTVAERTCPSGPNQAFGGCHAIDGIVVQNRSGSTHLVAVAVRVTITGPAGHQAVNIVIEAKPRLDESTGRYRVTE